MIGLFFFFLFKVKNARIVRTISLCRTRFSYSSFDRFAHSQHAPVMYQEPERPSGMMCSFVSFGKVCAQYTHRPYELYGCRGAIRCDGAIPHRTTANFLRNLQNFLTAKALFARAPKEASARLSPGPEAAEDQLAAAIAPGPGIALGGHLPRMIMPRTSSLVTSRTRAVPTTRPFFMAQMRSARSKTS